MRDPQRLLAAAGILALGALWMLTVTGATWYLGIRESPDYRCMVNYGGPGLAAYEAAGVSPEANVVIPTFRLLPLGWECRWDLAGDEYSYGPGSFPTALSGVGAVAAAAGAACTLAPLAHPRRRQNRR